MASIIGLILRSYSSVHRVLAKSGAALCDRGGDAAQAHETAQAIGGILVTLPLAADYRGLARAQIVPAEAKSCATAVKPPPKASEDPCTGDNNPRTRTWRRQSVGASLPGVCLLRQ